MCVASMKYNLGTNTYFPNLCAMIKIVFIRGHIINNFYKVIVWGTMLQWQWFFDNIIEIPLTYEIINTRFFSPSSSSNISFKLICPRVKAIDFGDWMIMNVTSLLCLTENYIACNVFLVRTLTLNLFFLYSTRMFKMLNYVYQKTVLEVV